MRKGGKKDIWPLVGCRDHLDGKRETERRRESVDIALTLVQNEMGTPCTEVVWSVQFEGMPRWNPSGPKYQLVNTRPASVSTH